MLKSMKVVASALSLAAVLAGCAAPGAWKPPLPRALGPVTATAADQSTCCEWTDQGLLACTSIAEAQGRTRPGALRCHGATIHGADLSSIDTGGGAH